MSIPVKHLDEFELSSNGLSKMTECKAQFWHKYIGHTAKLGFGRIYKMTSGLRVHSVEYSFWCFVRKKYLDLFPPELMQDISVENLTQRMMQIKIQMLFSVETQEYLPYMQSLSRIDAVRWVQLRDFYKGDVMKCYRCWIPVASEFAQYIVWLRTLVIIDRINIIPKGFFGAIEECLLIGDYKPGKFDDEGNPKLPDDIRNYDYGRFKRQLILYAYSVKFPGKAREPVDPETWFELLCKGKVTATKPLSLKEWLAALCSGKATHEHGAINIDILGDKRGKGKHPGGWCEYDHGLFGDLPDVMPVGYIGGFMYKTGQFLTEPVAKISITALEKAIASLWEVTQFPRNIDHRENGRCSWCEYKPECLNTLELLTKWGTQDGFIIPRLVIDVDTAADTDDD